MKRAFLFLLSLFLVLLSAQTVKGQSFQLRTGSTWGTISSSAPATRLTIPQGGSGQAPPGSVVSTIPPSHFLALSSLLEEETYDREYSRVDGGSIRSFKVKPNLSAAISRSNFFTRYEDLKLGPNFQMLEIPQKEEKLTDDLGIKHFRYAQTYRSPANQVLPVFDTQFILSEKAGSLISGRGVLATDLELKDIHLTPRIGEAEALNFALQALGKEYPFSGGSPTESPRGRLGITSKGFSMASGSFLLVWRFKIPTVDAGDFTVDIDAVNKNESGQLILVHKLSHTHYQLIPIEWTSNETCTGKGIYTIFLTFFCQKGSDGNYRLQFQGDSSTSANPAAWLLTIDSRPYLQEPAREAAIFSNNVSDEQAAKHFQEDNDRVGVEAHHNVIKTMEYFLKRHGYKGFDGEGTLPIRAELRTELGPDTAGKQHGPTMFLKATADSPENGPNVGPSTVAHEFTHGITEYTVPWQVFDGEGNVISSPFGLVYEGESGALSEGFADTFAVLVKYFINGGALDWCEHEDERFTQGSCNSHFGNPKNYRQPATYQAYDEFYIKYQPPCDETNDFCGVHTNGAVFTFWFYLLVSGGHGTNDRNQVYHVDPIKVEQAEKILWHALRWGLTPTAKFMDARRATIEAAEILFRDSNLSAEEKEYIIKNVTNAWHAVGVGDRFFVKRYSYPSNGNGNFDPWDGELLFQVFPDREKAWQVQISDSPEFPTALYVGEPANFFEITKWKEGVNERGEKINVAYIRANELQAPLKPNTTYFWRIYPTLQTPALQTPEKFKGINTFSQLFNAFKTPVKQPGSKSFWALDAGKFNAAERDAIDTLIGEGEVWEPTQFFTTHDMAPRLIKPGNREVRKEWEVDFSWEPISGAEQYQIHASTGPHYAGCYSISAVQSSSESHGSQTISTNVSPPAGGGSGTGAFVEALTATVPATQLGADGKMHHSLSVKGQSDYYWWVKARRGEHWGACSNKGVGTKFRVDTPVGELLSPPHGQVLPVGEVELKWKAVKGAGKYKVEAFKKEGNNLVPLPLAQPWVQGTTLKTSELIVNNWVYWQVTPFGPGDAPGIVSEKWAFRFDPSNLKPTLVSPLSSVINYQGPPIQFIWKAVPGAKNYRFAVFTRASIGGPLTQVETRESGFGSLADGNVEITIPNLATQKNVDYCWKVKVISPIEGPDSDWPCLALGPDQPKNLRLGYGEPMEKIIKLSLSWDSELADSYEVMVYVDGPCGAHLAIHQTGILDKSLAMGDFGYSRLFCAQVVAVYKGMKNTSAPFEFWSPKRPKTEDSNVSETPPDSCEKPPSPAVVGPNGIWPSGTIKVLWVRSEGATKYRYVVYYVNGGTAADRTVNASELSPLDSSPAGSKTLVSPTMLLGPGIYNWYVEAINSCGTAQSNIGGFTLTP